MASKESKLQREDDHSQQPRQHKTPSRVERQSKAVEDHLKEREKISRKTTKER
jgi:hypothetical protein